MIYLLYGQDTFRSLEKLTAIKDKYRKIAGDTNLLDIDEPQMPFEQIWQKISALPFLSSKRLVILKNLILFGNAAVQEKILKHLNKIPNTTVVILYEQGVPKSENILFKKICQVGRCQNFSLLKEWQLKEWIRGKARQIGLKINSAALEKLAFFVGNDLWQLSQELAKLKNYKENRPILPEDVELLVKPKIESDIFALIEAISKKNFQKTHTALQNLFFTGESEIYILQMIAWQFKNILICQDLLKQNNERRTIAKSGLHPFVAQKAIRQAHSFTWFQLKKIYSQILNFDFQIKTGKIEPKAALEILISFLSLQSKEDNCQPKSNLSYR